MITPLSHEYERELDIHFAVLPPDMPLELFGDRAFLIEAWRSLHSDTGDLPDRSDFTVARLLEDAARTGFVYLQENPRDAIFTLYPTEMVDRGSLNDWTGFGFREMMLDGYGALYVELFNRSWDLNGIAVASGYNPVENRQHIRNFCIGAPITVQKGSAKGMALTFCPLENSAPWKGLEHILQDKKTEITMKG